MVEFLTETLSHEGLQQTEDMFKIVPGGVIFNHDVEELKSISLAKPVARPDLGVVATGVTGMSVALLLPAVQQARNAARRMQFMNNMKQLGLATLNYESKHRTYPPLFSVDEDGKPLHSWRVLILPYLGQQELYDQIRLDEPWDSEWNSQFHNDCPVVYKDHVAISHQKKRSFPVSSVKIRCFARTERV